MTNVIHAHKEGNIPRSFILITLLYIIGSPATLFLLAEQQSLCLFAAVFTQMICYLYRYCRHHYTLDLFLFGMMTSFLFLIRFQAIFLIPLLILPFVVLEEKNKLIQEKLSVLMIAFFPAIFFVASWCYLNWVFMKDPFYFFKTWITAMGLENSPYFTPMDFKSSLIYTSQRLKNLFPFILPIFVSMLRRIRLGVKKCKVSPVILISPFALIFWDSFFGVTHEHSMVFSTIFTITALSCWLYVPADRKTPWIDRLFISSVLLSLLFTWTMLYKHHQENQFFKALVEPLKNTEMSNAKAIVKLLDKKGKILLDDKKGFSIVFFNGHPRRFVLPYQYEYETVLYAPKQFVRYIIVSSPTGDRISGRWQEALFGYLDGFKFIARFGRFILYEHL